MVTAENTRRITLCKKEGKKREAGCIVLLQTAGYECIEIGFGYQLRVLS